MKPLQEFALRCLTNMRDRETDLFEYHRLSLKIFYLKLRTLETEHARVVRI